MSAETDMPDWVPDEYDPDAPLRERLPIMAGIEGGIELHVQDDRGTVEIVDQPQSFTETRGTMKLQCGYAVDDWDWEIVVPEDDDPFLLNVDPHQSMEEYMRSKKRWMENIDVRMYGVDVDRFEESGSR